LSHWHDSSKFVVPFFQQFINHFADVHASRMTRTDDLSLAKILAFSLLPAAFPA
jgi:hypothetical protein